MFVFDVVGDVNAIVSGFVERLFGPVYVFFIDHEFFNVGVLPNIVLELRLKAECKRNIDGGVFQYQSADSGNLVRRDSFVRFPELASNAVAVQRDVLIVGGVDQEVVVIHLKHLFPYWNNVQITQSFGTCDVYEVQGA